MQTAIFNREEAKGQKDVPAPKDMRVGNVCEWVRSAKASSSAQKLRTANLRSAARPLLVR
jgi:hypothetical protein